MSESNPPATLPQHIAVVMDGNGRWARQRGLPRVAGHRKGGESVRNIIQLCADKRIPWLTIFAFSSENWRRPKQEVDRLMDLFVQALDKDVKELHKNNVRFRVIGDTQSLAGSIQDRVKKSELLTESNTGMVLTVALNYGGRWDISEACRKLALDIVNDKVSAEAVTPELLGQYISTHDTPDPDLFIRTGGEQRISNFLLWQLAYTELYFTDVLWPDFGEAELDLALEAFSGRQRRFGQTSEQVEVG